MVAAAIAGAAVIGGVATSVSGSKAAKAQKSAAAQQAASAQKDLEQQRYFYDTARADYAPYRNVGYGALDKLAGMYGVTPRDASGKPIAGAKPVSGTGYANDGGFTASPGYQFRLNEGIKAAERSAAARGVLGSGGTMKAIQRYGEGLAASEYDTYSNRLAALAGVGQSATGSTTQAGATAASGISNALTASGNAAVNAGNARASSYANTGSAINSSVNNLASLYLYQQGGGFGGGGGRSGSPTGGNI